MCVTMGAALAAAGGVFGALGNIAQGQAAARAGAYQSAVARNRAAVANVNAAIERNNAQMRREDADIAERYAERTLVAGSARTQAYGMGAAARLGGIKARQAASGVDVNSGSNVDVRAGTRELAKLDAETIMSDTAWQNYGLRQRARNLRYEADISETRAGLYGNQATLDYTQGQYAADEGEYAKEAASLQALGSLATSARSISFNWPGGDGGGFQGTPGGAEQYGSPGYEGSLTYGGPR